MDKPQSAPLMGFSAPGPADGRLPSAMMILNDISFEMKAPSKMPGGLGTPSASGAQAWFDSGLVLERFGDRELEFLQGLPHAFELGVAV